MCYFFHLFLMDEKLFFKLGLKAEVLKQIFVKCHLV